MRIKMLFPRGLDKALTLSYDDAKTTDIRLIRLMEKYGVKGTFNINTAPRWFPPEEKEYPKGEFGRMTRRQCLEIYKSENVEVAAHGRQHANLTQLDNDGAFEELIRDKQEIERMFQVPCRGFAYAGGKYDNRSVKILERCGFAYARTVEGTHRFDLPHDWLRMGTTCHHNAENLPELADAFLADEPNLMEPKLFFLWGHASEFEKDDKWWVIENFLEKVGNREDVWYATNIEIYDYMTAYDKLIYSYDRDIVQNPTATDVWLMVIDGEQRKTFCIPSGAVVNLEM